MNPSDDDINAQRQLLETYRTRLKFQLDNAAKHSEGSVPTDILFDIDKARRDIHRIKMNLRAKGEIVEDWAIEKREEDKPDIEGRRKGQASLITEGSAYSAG